MSLYARTDATFRMDFGDRGWVELREEITAGDRKIAVAAARGPTEAKVPKKRGQGVQSMSTEFSDQAYAIALLKEMIVAWSEDEAVTRENIKKLPQWMLDQLMEELDERNGGRTEEELGPLESSSPEPSEKDDEDNEAPGLES
jgi:hypothetical protein